MGCFLVPGALAVVTTVFRKRIPARYHIGWLNTMLWGGTLGLALEHVANNEIVAYPPFLTSMTSAAGISSMLEEIATVGVAIAVVFVAVWAATVVTYNRLAHESAEADKTFEAS
jgi:hypothetical protein